VSKSVDASLATFTKAGREMTMPVMVSDQPPAGMEILPDAEYALSDFYDDKISVISYTVNRIEIKFAAQKPALFATTEGFHPGWRAELDGREVPTVKVNFAFRGVYVPAAGTHRLVWEFKPKSFYRGLWVSVSGAIVLAVWIILVLVQAMAQKDKTKG
jgi:uncharacterized membrane protein YfhO